MTVANQAHVVVMLAREQFSPKVLFVVNRLFQSDRNLGLLFWQFNTTGLFSFFFVEIFHTGGNTPPPPRQLSRKNNSKSRKGVQTNYTGIFFLNIYLAHSSVESKRITWDARWPCVCWCVCYKFSRQRKSTEALFELCSCLMRTEAGFITIKH